MMNIYRTAGVGVLFLVGYLGIALCSGCSPAQSAGHRGKPPPRTEPNLYFIGIDGSGSYDYLDCAKASVEAIIQHAPEGSTISVWWITADSYSPAGAILTEKVPLMRANQQSGNPFNKRAKIEAARRKAHIRAWRRTVIDKITSAKFPNARHTDILGLITLASERFKNVSGPRCLIILSDLDNNAHKYAQYIKDGMLDGVSVVVGAYEHNDPAQRNQWERRFKKLGARKVQFIGPDESTVSSFASALGLGDGSVKERGTND